MTPMYGFLTRVGRPLGYHSPIVLPNPDADGAILTSALQPDGKILVGGPPVALSGPTAVSPTLIAPSTTAMLTFGLVVTDSFGLASAPDEVLIVVRSPPTPINPLTTPSHHANI